MTCLQKTVWLVIFLAGPTTYAKEFRSGIVDPPVVITGSELHSTPKILFRLQAEPPDTIFYGSDNKPTLTFKANGDIIYKGRKLGTDKEMVAGLRDFFVKAGKK